MNTVTRYQDHAAFTLKLVLGVILLAHGLLTLIVFTPSGTATYFASLGFPEVLAGAAWVHLSNGWVFSNQGGGWESPALLVIIAAIIATQGAGSYATKTLA